MRRQLGVDGQQVKNVDHDLAGRLGELLATPLDQPQCDGERFFVAGRGRQRLGQAQLQVQVVRVGGNGRATTFRTAGLLTLHAQVEQRLEPLRFRFEKTARLEPIDDLPGLVGSILRKQQPRQADGGRRQFGASLTASR